MPTKILLLKTKSTPQDGYEDFFTSNNSSPTFIPVLEHRFHHENLARVRGLFESGAFCSEHTETPDELNSQDGHGNINGNRKRKRNGRGSGRQYGGMIFTSQRAVEALTDMMERDGFPNTKYTPTIPLYTVGPATARSLQSLRDKYLPNATIHGADAGNGENLAWFILEHYNSLHPPMSTPESTSTCTGPNTEQDHEGDGDGFERGTKPALLFLVGEQRRDIIPKTLMSPSLPASSRIPVDEMVVYETGEMDSFEGQFAAAVRSFRNSELDGLDATADGNDHDQVLWVVVFSPTGCEGMLRVLGLGPFGGSDPTGGDPTRRVLVATIGPTTRDFLQREFGFEPDVCAESPSPEGVGEGIRRFMELRASCCD